MKILISVVDPNEAIDALAGGADIIDVKDPSKGSLGAPDVLVINSIKKTLPSDVVVSIALGDNPRDEHVIELASIAESHAINYVKAGSLGLKDINDAINAYRSIKSGVSRVKLVAVAYADYHITRCLSPMEVLDAAYKSDFEVFMIDTLVKNGRSTFDYLDRKRLLEIKEKAHEKGMLFALAGSLSLNHADEVSMIRPDIVGFRGAACNGNRVKGKVSRVNVELLVKKYRHHL
ncbi:MAG: (5-formylfuran-3-yl)methyl phosphate synthase [Candidatus Nezhaarchaeales archaeon]